MVPGVKEAEWAQPPDAPAPWLPGTQGSWLSARGENELQASGHSCPLLLGLHLIAEGCSRLNLCKSRLQGARLQGAVPAAWSALRGCSAWAQRPEPYAEMAFRAPPGPCLPVPAETNMKDLVKVTSLCSLSLHVGSLSHILFSSLSP